ncbi:hypothetical protein [Comamonas sp. C24C]
MQDKKQLRAPEHSTACLYGYALARLGLTDAPQMRVLFWDAQEALKWDEKTDRYISPAAEGECKTCGHISEPTISQAATAAVHDSDCAMHNAPAFPAGDCDCSAQAAPAAVAVPDERTAFEAWATAQKYDLSPWGDTYDSDYTSKAWDAWQARAALAATPAAIQTASAPTDTAIAASLEFLESPVEGERTYTLTIQNIKTLIAEFSAPATPAAATPVVLPEPQHWVLETQAPDREFDYTGVQKKSEHWKAIGLNPTALFTEQQLRAALLAGVSAPAALAVASIYVTADGQRECDDWKMPLPIGRNLLYTAPQTPADARDAEQEKPPAGRYVLAWIEGKDVPIRAMWVPQYFLECGDECPEGWGEYSEEQDEYFCPEGWYEANEHEETHWHVSKPVVAWIELPRRPAIAAQAAQQGDAA